MIDTDDDLQRIVCTLNSVDHDNEIGFGNWQKWIVNIEFKGISTVEINNNITKMINEINEKIKEDAVHLLTYNTMLLHWIKSDKAMTNTAFA